jgi:ribonuclease HII
MQYVVGLDEAGRGPWAGPVVAAAVILDPNHPIVGLKDSKKLSEKKRDYLFEEIQLKALAFGIGRASVEEIDALNILQATFLAMTRAIEHLPRKPSLALVDGHLLPPLPFPAKAIIGGDNLEPAISAASILAKVSRDREMIHYDTLYPHGFARHKGYGTKAHRAALEAFGVCELHRKSFAPISALLR